MFKVGDVVRIRSRQELINEGRKFNGRWVLDKWHNSICRVTEECQGERFKLEFIYEVINPCDKTKLFFALSDYDWYPFELEPVEKESYSDVTEISLYEILKDNQ